mgnify:CR=1 FL=1
MSISTIEIKPSLVSILSPAKSCLRTSFVEAACFTLSGSGGRPTPALEDATRASCADNSCNRSWSGSAISSVISLVSGASDSHRASRVRIPRDLSARRLADLDARDVAVLPAGCLVRSVTPCRVRSIAASREGPVLCLNALCHSHPNGRSDGKVVWIDRLGRARTSDCKLTRAAGSTMPSGLIINFGHR